MDSVIECNVWCVGEDGDHARDLGLPEGDSWMPFAVDFATVSSIKLAGENDFLGDDKATIYFNGREVTIDVTFKDAVLIWKKILSKAPNE